MNNTVTGFFIGYFAGLFTVVLGTWMRPPDDLDKLDNKGDEQ